MATKDVYTKSQPIASVGGTLYAIDGPTNVGGLYNKTKAKKLLHQLNCAYNAGSQWVPVSKDSQPPANSTVVYLMKPQHGGYMAIADEWKWEDHGEYASHYLPASMSTPDQTTTDNG